VHDPPRRGARQHPDDEFAGDQRLLHRDVQIFDTRSDNSPQITCAKAVPPGKEVEMCRLTSGGDKFVDLIEGHADCLELRLSNPE